MTVQIPTVLVLGAASSIHCGYPLGMTLISNIVQLQQRPTGIPLPSSWSDDELQQFTNRLARSGHYSIDAFLETVPEHIRLGKYLITYCLKQLESVDRLFPPNQSGWYQYLFNSLIGSSSSPFSDNQLTIVTYNYDRSLEAYLYHALIGRFDMTESDAAAELAKLPIIHVHGVLGRLPEVAYRQAEDADVLLQISEGIKIIHELSDGQNDFLSDEFVRAHDALSRAEKVAFLGFGFHTDNVRRLRVDWAANPNRKVFSTFAGMSQLRYKSLTSRLAPLGLTSQVLPFGGSYGCEDFFNYVMALE